MIYMNRTLLQFVVDPNNLIPTYSMYILFNYFKSYSATVKVFNDDITKYG